MFSPKRLIALALLSCAAAVAALAQSGTGQLTGTVSDQQGARVAGAGVVVTGLDTGATRRAETDGEGNFAVTLLQPGRYNVEVTAPGFGRLLVETTVNVTQTTTLDLAVAPALGGETVTVTDQGSLVQQESSQVGRVIQGETLRQLPLPTRNFQQIGRAHV